jgi:hypothetical protein
VKAARRVVFAGALAALSGCSSERILAFANAADAGGSSDGGGSPGDADGNPTDGSSSTAFGPAQVVTGLRGDAYDVQDPSMTFEELELYFASPTGGLNDIWVATRIVATDSWGPSTMVAELSSPDNDQDPEISVDGLVMFLSSDRGGAGTRLYVSQRRTRDTPWGQPVLLDTLGSSALDEAPALDRAQLKLVFASVRGAASIPHLYTSTRQSAVELAALSSAWEDTDPALFNEGRGVVFASRRASQGGTADLFQTARADVSAPFTSPIVPITELNTSFSEEDPWLSQDGRHILFVSDRDGRSRIYEARR